MVAFIAMVPRQLDEDGKLSSIRSDSGKISSDILRGMPKESEGMTGKY
jgi:hypothetical protein